MIAEQPVSSERPRQRPGEPTRASRRDGESEHVLLSATEVFAAGAGAYWQFHPGGPARTPFAPDAVYLEVSAVDSLATLLGEATRWFIADGVSRLDDRELGELAATLADVARMPDEPGRRECYLALARWLSAKRPDSVWVQRQRFAP